MCSWPLGQVTMSKSMTPRLRFSMLTFGIDYGPGTVTASGSVTGTAIGRVTLSVRGARETIRHLAVPIATIVSHTRHRKSILVVLGYASCSDGCNGLL